MSAPHTLIRRAFETRLATLSGLPAVAWENAPFPTPPATEKPSSYLEPHLLPGEPFQAEIGTNGINRHTGVYQISIYVKAGTGPAALDTLRDAIVNHFKRGTILTHGGLSVTCQKAYPGPPMQETDWVHVPVTIMFRCDSPN